MARRGENIYKRKDGRWEGRYRNGFNANGKVKYSSIYGKSYAEVSASLNKKKSEQKNSSKICKYTFGKLADLWINNIQLTVKESTYANYMLKLEKHIKPAFSGVRYEKLTAENLNNFINQKIADGLSVKYISDIISVIKAVCKFAHKQYNYEDKSMNITIPRQGTKSEKKLLNYEEQTLLNKYLTENPSASNIGILLSIVTGIRIGELCALRWNDIDIEKRIITVRHTVQRIKNFKGNTATKIVITEPKSSTSFREIPLPEFIMPILEKLRLGDNCYILSGTEKVIEPRTMQYRFKSILKKLCLPDVNYHSLRHAFATKAIIVGFDIKTLSEILGHSSVEITMNRYVHSSITRKIECMKLMSIGTI